MKSTRPGSRLERDRAFLRFCGYVSRMSEKGGFVCSRHERFVHPGEQCPMCEPEGFDPADGPYRVVSRTRIKGGWREERAYAARHGTVEYDVLDEPKPDHHDQAAARISGMLNRWCGPGTIYVDGTPVCGIESLEISFDDIPVDIPERIVARTLDDWCREIDRMIADTVDAIVNGNGGKPIGLLDDLEE